MLSPEHVRVRRRGKELQLLALSGDLRARAVALAAELRALALAHVGRTREELWDAWSALEVAPREKKLVAGLAKLVEDDTQFEAGDADQAADLRRALFSRAAERRRGDAGSFEREGIVAAVAAERGLTPSDIEGLLYADLRGAQRVTGCVAPSEEALVERFESAQVQAVLLRAVRVVADVECAGGDAYRTLFRKLKFRRLLHRVTPLAEGGYRIEIDGPFSLFQSVAKYGLELALTLPALEACRSLRLSADVRWSSHGSPLVFRYERRPASAAVEPPPQRDEVSELSAGIRALGSEWSVDPAEKVLDLPGVGVCVPDLVLRRARDGQEVLVEVLGYWSRESVWRRVELAQRGLGARLLLVVSSRLRVSEEVLEDTDDAALYVYKGRINARSVLRHAEELVQSSGAERPRARRPS